MPLQNKAHNPHDGFFQFNMRNIGFISNFFEKYLPPSILNHIDLKTLEIKKDSFIDSELKRFYSDILYQVAIKNHKAYFYLLFEHKSSPEKFIAFILLKYIVKIWELEQKQHPKLNLLPPIIPLVFYHGEDKWNIGGRLSDIVFLGDSEELRLWIPDFTYTIYDFSPYSDTEIKGDIILRICLSLFKHIFDKDLSHVRRIIHLLEDLSLKERTTLEFIEATFLYIMSAREDATPETLKEIVEKTILKEAGGVIMTVAEKLRQEGRKEGILEAIKMGLEIKFGIMGLSLLPRIEKEEDIAKLDIIKESIKKAHDIKEIEEVI